MNNQIANTPFPGSQETSCIERHRIIMSADQKDPGPICSFKIPFEKPE